ncbi:ATP-binding cassette domain-containing protein [Halalkalicoccus jeotgali]|nr:ATP-binding cassette domain-containing protein [Halalkalicoccus jeotgali]
MTAKQRSESENVMESTVLELDGLSKAYGAIQALDDVSFAVRENEVLALMGDNGAGKSTLIKILSGVNDPTRGMFYVNGQEANFGSYEDAEAAGIATVYQDLAIAPNRTVKENVFLGKEPLVEGKLGEWLRIVDDDEMERQADKVLNELGMEIDPNADCGDLSGGQQQSVAIARAIESDPDIVIMDEPTSALSVEAADRILNLIERLKEQGRTVLLVDHNLEEVFEVADRAAVLASGRLVGVEDIDRLDQESMIQMMMGSELDGDASVAGTAAE